jgi:hypothetical protein
MFNFGNSRHDIDSTMSDFDYIRRVLVVPKSISLISGKISDNTKNDFLNNLQDFDYTK